jgi:transcription initiation factor TFIIB
MSESSTTIEECPACGAEKIKYWEELETWICERCSYVVEGGVSKKSIPDFSEEIDEDEINDRTWDQSLSIKDKSEANLVEVLSQVEEVADELALSDELEIRAAEIVVEAWTTNFMHGRTKQDTVGAAVYAATRQYQRSIPPSIIADAISGNKQDIKNTYQQLKSEQNLDINPPTPQEFVDAICEELGLSERVSESAVEKLSKTPLPAGNPIGIGAAAVYVACTDGSEDLTLRRVATVTGLTKETVWRQASAIRED